MVGIYKITSPTNKIYIGQSINISIRKSAYKCLDRRVIGPKIYNSLKKYGWEAHKFEIVEECNVGDLYEREIYWKIDSLKLVGEDWSKCLFCNLHDVGSFGPLSEHIKEKLRGQKRSTETKHKMREAKLGKPSNFKDHQHSNKTKQKMRELKLGNPSNNPKKPILQYDVDGNFIREWESIHSLRLSGFNVYGIFRCCNNKQSKSLNFVWRYK